MSLSDNARRSLSKNPNVLKVTNRNITYTPEFKLEAIKQYEAGRSADAIFQDYGIDSKLFNTSYCRKCILRWIEKRDKDGDDSFFDEKRGVHSSGRPKKLNVDELSVDEMKVLLEVQQGVIEELKKRHALARKK